jgi:hypothetical protein
MPRKKITFGMRERISHNTCYYQRRLHDGSRERFGQECEGEMRPFQGSYSRTIVDVCEYHFKQLLACDRLLSGRLKPVDFENDEKISETAESGLLSH